MNKVEENHSSAPIVMVVIAVLLWSTGGLLIKFTSLDAYSVNFGRAVFAAIVVAVFTYKKGLYPNKFTFFTSFLYAATLTCYVIANKNTTAANAIFLQYTAPIYVLILSPFVLSEKFQIRDLATVVLCLIGMSFFFFEEGSASAYAPNIFLGNIFALISGVFFGLYLIFLRHQKSLDKNPAISVFYGNLIIVFVMLPLILGDTSRIAEAGWIDLATIAFLGIFQIGIAYILFTNGLAKGVRSMDASIIGFLEPLFNPFWVFLFLKEKPSFWALIGGSIIITTVFIHSMLNYQRSRRLRAGYDS